MHKLRLAIQLIQYFGIRWLLYRIYYAVQLRIGYFRYVLPTYEWHERPLSFWLDETVPSNINDYVKWREHNAPRFFFDDALRQIPTCDANPTILIADEILDGKWVYFSNELVQVGIPPDWHRNPLTGQKLPDDKHWSQISDFEAGDIKFIWEANRFSVVYTLVRAYYITKDDKYATFFWRLIEDWAQKNPPQRGANWKCGQEASFRVMAWCFGLYALMKQGSPQQIATLITMIAAHGERIEKNIAYARSQNNNHGISETVGLWTIGILFPEFKYAETWVEIGKEGFEAEMRKQTYDDGSYAQYSPNYQRVMLHDAIWALRLGELNNCRFADKIYKKVEASKNFLLQIIDNNTGYVPNHGSNDSALILPLNEKDPRDFRPVIQAAHYLTQKTIIFDEIYEDMYWLFGVNPEDVTHFVLPDIEKLSAEIGGYYTLRGNDSWLMVRCAEYRARPHHADQLHVDFWWRGINILCDAGTYLYNGDLPWKNGLAGTAVHNTVMVDNQDQMTSYSRFLWLDWSRGQVSQHDNQYWEGSHDGYTRLNSPTTHRRGIQIVGDCCIIADELKSTNVHSYVLHWLIPNLPHQVASDMIKLETDRGQLYMYFASPIRVDSAEADGVVGWRSTYYGSREPALAVTLNVEARNIILWTILSPREISIRKDEQNLHIEDLYITLGQDRLIEIG